MSIIFPPMFFDELCVIVFKSGVCFHTELSPEISAFTPTKEDDEDVITSPSFLRVTEMLNSFSNSGNSNEILII